MEGDEEGCGTLTSIAAIRRLIAPKTIVAISRLEFSAEDVRQKVDE